MEGGGQKGNFIQFNNLKGAIRAKSASRVGAEKYGHGTTSLVLLHTTAAMKEQEQTPFVDLADISEILKLFSMEGKIE